MAGDPHVSTQLPNSVVSALEGNAVDQILMDLQGAPITFVDDGPDGPGSEHGSPPAPTGDGDGPSIDRFFALRSQLGVEATGMPATERNSLPPQRIDLSEREEIPEEAHPTQEISLVNVGWTPEAPARSALPWAVGTALVAAVSVMAVGLLAALWLVL
ncbi:MAG: hypothetical protein H6738_24745 [Alphaproteobacteria bacterium]|nr:hypothetical protein [Alphaproteobacteria bacterium]MCB9700019.1 hypothetical protein [Alphaproteobacteria bacterium]